MATSDALVVASARQTVDHDKPPTTEMVPGTVVPGTVVPYRTGMVWYYHTILPTLELKSMNRAVRARVNGCFGPPPCVPAEKINDPRRKACLITTRSQPEETFVTVCVLCISVIFIR